MAARDPEFSGEIAAIVSNTAVVCTIAEKPDGHIAVDQALCGAGLRLGNTCHGTSLRGLSLVGAVVGHVFARCGGARADELFSRKLQAFGVLFDGSINLLGKLRPFQL